MIAGAYGVNLKGWISRAYDSSEAGMKTLGYDGPPQGISPDAIMPAGTGDL